MTAENVTVVDQQGRLLTNSKGNSQLAASTEQFRFVRDVESNYSRRIVELLTPMVGPDRVSAQVSVDMDFTSVEKTSELFQPDRRAVRSEQLVEESSSGQNSGGGIAGALSNAPSGRRWRTARRRRRRDRELFRQHHQKHHAQFRAE